MCPDDLTRRRFLAATAGTAGVAGGAVVTGAAGVLDDGACDYDRRRGRPTAGSDSAPPNGTVTAVVDRFEDDRAVLVLERDGETAGELVIDAERLPDDGRTVDAVFEVVLSEGAPTDVAFRPERTEHRAESAQRRFDRLSRPTCDDAR